MNTRKNLETGGPRAQELEAIPPLTELLEELRGFGEVGLYGYPTGEHFQGWRCKVDISGAVAGVNGTVQSEWRHQVPETAAAECLERCRAAFGKR